MTKKIVSVKNLSYYINGKNILRNISLSIQKGEFVGLIGPNGAGKTTLLKCINGINRAEGNVELDGKSIHDMSSMEIAKSVAFMHQNTNISFPFTAIQIVLMGRFPYLNSFGVESRGDYEIARKYMAYTDSLDYENTPITKLSGGEAQRVFFAKALTQETELLLLDEPTASLDINHQEQIFDYCSKLAKEGKTIVSAVHDLSIASKYCTRLVLMKSGEIIADDTTEEVLNSKNISNAYDMNALVYRNSMTGLKDIYISSKITESHRHVHVIGGGGSATGVIRYLFEKGYKISGGIFSYGDSDLKCAETFGINYVAAKPYTEICDESKAENLSYIENAELTVLCNMPFGMQNIENLQAAAKAEKLIIIEDEPPETRDFSGGEALKLYKRLAEKAVIISSDRIHEVL